MVDSIGSRGGQAIGTREPTFSKSITHLTSFQMLIIIISSLVLALPCIHTISIAALGSDSHPFCSPSDYTSLKAFQTSTFSHLPWPNNTNCCTWPGIQCNHHGHVVALHVPSMDLRGFLSPRLFHLSALDSLDLSNNSFYSRIPSDLTSLSNLTTLDLSHNPLLTGFFPSQLPSKLRYLDLSHCSFHGAIPPSFSNMSTLKQVYLAHNQFSSFIPSEFSSMEALQIFDASHNLINGNIPHYILNCTRLRILNLNNNRLGSQVPSDLGKLRNLHTLQLQGNGYRGVVPPEIGNCTQLKQAWLDDNSFTGSLPDGFSRLASLRALSLANNSLQGTFPAPILQCTQLSFLSLSGNKLSGELPAALGSLTNLKVLLLDGNDFSGFIPAEIGDLRLLQVLDLSKNRLKCSIPHESRSKSHHGASFNYGVGAASLNISSEIWIWRWVLDNGLKQKFADLESNTMKGYIQCSIAGNNTGLHYVNLTSNHLAGLVSTSLEVLHYCDVPDCDGMQQGALFRRRFLREGQGSRKRILIGVGVFGAAVLLLGILVLCRLKLGGVWRHRRLHGRAAKKPSLRKFRRETSRVFDPSIECISMHVLERATDGFDEGKVIGGGGFGLVFSATLPDGRAVAVKKLSTDGMQGTREFEAEMETLGKIKHPNLVELLAYCSVGDDRVLVYEFIENGSLDTWLHEKEEGPKMLSWELRLRIAQGTAGGLAYLHHECNPHVIHRDIKSGNILLGKEFEARIADFGLARNVSPLVSHVSTEGAGSLGYMAPEYSTTLRATRRADVYSFGMVLLELATGRRPNVSVKERNLRTLVKWACQLHAEAHELELLDPVLKKGAPPPSYEQVAAYFTIACECVKENPAARPTMDLVFMRLAEIGGADQAS